MPSLSEHVDAVMNARKMLRAGASVLVAASGGQDSMVLLHLLQSIATRHGWKLAVAHFNHQLRGRASNADERLVRKTCEELGVPCESGAGNVERAARERGLSIEMAARELRHAFLAETAATLGMRTIALAHHADDQVELFLLRLLRGSSTLGLGGMHWTSPSPANQSLTLIRPLLGVRKTDLAAYAREHKVKFREDASNAESDFLRNRVRNELLPLLRQDYQPAIASVLLRQADLLREDADFILAETRRVVEAGNIPYQMLSPALQRRVLHMRLIAAGIQPDFALVEKLRNEPGKWTMVSADVSCRATAGGEIERRVAPQIEHATPAEHQINVSSATSTAFDGITLSWKVARGSRRPKRRANFESFDADRIGERVTLRHWRPGDRIQPIGMQSSLKLQDLFVNNKVPRPLRHRLVVAATEGGDIFWVEGLRISEHHKITGGTKRRLEWSWTRPTESAPEGPQ